MNTRASTVDKLQTAVTEEKPFAFVLRKPQFLIGLILVSFLLIQHYYDVPWGVLDAWQQNSLYKQLSGFFLLFYVLAQWRLTHLRFSKRGAEAREHLSVHKWLGAIAPLFIFMHTTDLGYAYQFFLWGVFIATILIGLFNFQDIKVIKNWFMMSWTILHVTLAVILPFLILYHVYISYIYS